jgi:hypothetical protein
MKKPATKKQIQSKVSQNLNLRLSADPEKRAELVASLREMARDAGLLYGGQPSVSQLILALASLPKSHRETISLILLAIAQKESSSKGC